MSTESRTQGAARENDSSARPHKHIGCGGTLVVHVHYGFSKAHTIVPYKNGWWKGKALTAYKPSQNEVADMPVICRKCKATVYQDLTELPR